MTLAEGQALADEVVSLLEEWLQVVAPPVMIVPSRRSSATGALRPPEDDAAPVEEEVRAEWVRWALLAGAGAGLGLAVVCWLLLR